MNENGKESNIIYFLTLSTAHAIRRKAFPVNNNFQGCRALPLVLAVNEPTVVERRAEGCSHICPINLLYLAFVGLRL